MSRFKYVADEEFARLRELAQKYQDAKYDQKVLSEEEWSFVKEMGDRLIREALENEEVHHEQA